MEQMKLNDKKVDSNLKKAYLEALKDDDFKMMVSKLHMSDEELMKYTSDLEESLKNFKNCANCKGLAACKNKLIGYAYLPLIINNNLSFGYRSCRYKEAENKAKAYEKYVFTFDTPIEIKEASLKNIYKDDKKRYNTIKWLTNFIKNYGKEEQKGLYLHGNFGCGKTYLIAAAFNELATKKVSSAIIFWPEFLRTLKANFNTNNTDLFEKVKKTELLLIDDIGAENTTAWSRDDVFCPLIQYRMENHLPTFFTSNLNLKELEEHFSISKGNVDQVKARRIISRIEQLTDDIEMISVNLRK